MQNPLQTNAHSSTARARKSVDEESPASDDNVVSPAPVERSETELRLERELAVLLGRRPKRHAIVPTAGASLADAVAPAETTTTARLEAPPPLRARPASKTVDSGAATADEGMPTDADDEPEATNATGPSREVPIERPRWMDVARRSRRTAGWRAAASWIVAVGVVVFIVAAVTVIVVGLPKGMVSWPSLQAAPVMKPPQGK